MLARRPQGHAHPDRARLSLQMVNEHMDGSFAPEHGGVDFGTGIGMSIQARHERGQTLWHQDVGCGSSPPRSCRPSTCACLRRGSMPEKNEAMLRPHSRAALSNPPHKPDHTSMRASACLTCALCPAAGHGLHGSGPGSWEGASRMAGVGLGRRQGAS